MWKRGNMDMPACHGGDEANIIETADSWKLIADSSKPTAQSTKPAS